jgi:AcrR family transcriptional regulator
MLKSRATPNIDLARRAEIAAEKRARTRAGILLAAFRLIGEERGDFQRVEDFCTAAAVSRGTFYNYFTGVEQLYDTLATELSRDFDVAVHGVIEQLKGPSAQTAAAVRYYMRAAMDNPRWGWAMVHTSLGKDVFGPDVSERAKRTIQQGIDAGEFNVSSAELGKVLLLGSGLAGILDIVRGRVGPEFPEDMARHILIGLGVPAAKAGKLITLPLPALTLAADDTGASPVNFWATTT